MELDLLKSFLAVAEAHSFSGAAQAVHSTQPTLSRQIARLEAELGAQLFDRYGRHVECTAVGQMLLPLAQAITVRVDDALSTVRSHVGTGSRTVRFGAPQRVFARVLAPILVSFATAYSNVKVDLFEKEDTLVEEAVVQGELDCGVITAGRSARTAAQHLLSDEVVILMGKTHRLARNSEVELAQLARESILLPPSTMNLANVVADAFRQAGFRPRMSYRVETPELIAELVRNSPDVAPIPKMLLPEKHEGLTVVRLAKPFTTDLVFLYPKGHPPAPVVRVLSAHIRAGLAGKARSGARRTIPRPG